MPKTKPAAETKPPQYMLDLHRRLGEKFGMDGLRGILDGARQAKLRRPDLLNSEASLRMFQQIEKEIFGDLGPLNEGEWDLTVPNPQPPDQAGSRQKEKPAPPAV